MALNWIFKIHSPLKTTKTKVQIQFQLAQLIYYKKSFLLIHFTQL